MYMNDIKIKYKNINIDKEYLQKIGRMVYRFMSEGNFDKKSNNFQSVMDSNNYYDDKFFNRVNSIANKIRKNTKVFIVVGNKKICKGIKSVLEASKGELYNEIAHLNDKAPRIIFIDENIEASYLNAVLSIMDKNEVCMNIITDVCPSIELNLGYRVLINKMREKYTPEELQNRVVITTDEHSGQMRALAILNSFNSFIIPKKLCRNELLLTPAGLLPMAVAGVNINQIIKGAKGLYEETKSCDDNNVILKYIALRSALTNSGRTIENIISYNSSLKLMNGWLQDVMNGDGLENRVTSVATELLPSSIYATDSIKRKSNTFMTKIIVRKMRQEYIFELDEENLDGLNFLKDKKISHIAKSIEMACNRKEDDFDIPKIEIEVPKINEQVLGRLMYFFIKVNMIEDILLGKEMIDETSRNYKEKIIEILNK